MKSRKTIGHLFKDGRSLSAFPLRLIWKPIEEEEKTFPVQVAFSIPKRSFAKAAHRNRLRRQVKEAWRLNKAWLYKNLKDSNNRYAFMIIYIGKESLPYEKINAAVRKMNRKFLWQLSKQRSD